MKTFVWISRSALVGVLLVLMLASPAAADMEGGYMGQVTDVDVVEHAIEIDDHWFRVPTSVRLATEDGGSTSLGRVEAGQWIEYRVVEDARADRPSVRDVILYSSPQE
ncbi:hypothetical protein [Thioalkalivibrio sp. ALE20]|uniref:PilY2 family type 4a fimbrial biogenesis protein n=1 Tax=Thioalkalivibrio sp. ALE20 TaxID=545275 RepID=UPI00037A64FD|nr:hypothetical protein [Thioalkalivibrio sp. ALE20]